MAKKKYKLSKKQQQKLKSLSLFLAIFAIGLALGVTLIKFNATNKGTPKNLVWAADNTVKIPASLRKFLVTRNDCGHYKGNGSPDGVGLWSVYQVSNERFAKIAYGCSWNLTSYIMAVKQNNGWILVPPKEYFAEFKDSPGKAGALPNCSQLEKYKINKSIEPFCITTDGTAKTNDI